MCEDQSSNTQQHPNLRLQSPLYTAQAKKLEKQLPLLKITGFQCDLHVNTSSANSETMNGNETSDISQESGMSGGSNESGFGGALRSLLAEYGDFRINYQWDPLRSRESPLSEVVTENSSSEYTTSEASTPRGWGQEQRWKTAPYGQGQEQGKEWSLAKFAEGQELYPNNMMKMKCGDEETVRKKCTDRTMNLVCEEFDSNRICKEEQEKQILTSNLQKNQQLDFEIREGYQSSSLEEEEQDNDKCVELDQDLVESRTLPIPIPDIQRMPSEMLNDFESQGLLQAMIDNFVKGPVQSQAEEEHRVVMQYSTKEELRIKEADLSMALMKIQELQYQYIYVSNENLVLKKELVESESAYNNVQQVEADAHETQIIHLQEESSYYRENCEQLEELAACQQDQIQYLTQQVAQLTDSQKMLKVKLSKKEDINLAMHNRIDELNYELEMTKQMMQMQYEELVEDFEIEVENSATAQENHLAEIEHATQRQRLLEEQNKILCQQIAVLQKQQEQSILVAPLVRNVVDFVIAGMAQFANGCTLLTNQSLRLFFNLP